VDASGAIAVTGASRGIGSAIARELAGRGFTVACLTRKGLGVEDAAPPEGSAGRLLAYRCDVIDEKSVAAALRTAADAAGGLRGLVNNAGIHREQPSEEMTTDEFLKVLTTNAVAAFAVCREAFPFLVRSGGGLIVNIGSLYDKLGIPRHVAYCASKAAVGALTRCLAVDWARHGIRVVDVAPGFIATDLNKAYLESERFEAYLRRSIPIGRGGTTEEVARLVAALFVEDIPFLTGETIYVDGGQGVLR
jgi:NAD(P)-dependent dehydrogenase (short-subunit alcohol dehydrogenase family)